MMSATRDPNDLKLHSRTRMTSLPPEDRGPMITACQCARGVWEGKVSAKWIIQHFAGLIGFKIGKPWYFYENEARVAKDRWIAEQRGESQ
jgi:hypothetical protein